MLRRLILMTVALLAAALGHARAAERPHILWLVSEDHSPQLGCYGDGYARTPNLDALSKRSLRYSKAISNAPVCAAARTTLIAGMYASSTGGEHMRSRVEPPGFLRCYPELLRAAGYFTSNNAKEDYNFNFGRDLWDESSGKASYTGRGEGQPFLAIFNNSAAHESKLHDTPAATLSDPAMARVPAYFPDTPEVRHDLAHYNDCVSRADEWVGKQLRALNEAGLEEETIVFFFSDHGGALARGKRFPGWSGLHVPLIVYFPEKWRHLAPPGYQPGQTSERLVSFVDFAPTLLSLAGAEIPQWLEGSAFLGKAASADPEFAFGLRGRMDERPDVCRSATDGRFIYLRNFQPQLAHGQYYSFQQKAASARQWRGLFGAGKLTPVQAAYWQPHPPEELFDLQSDPDEIHNLAKDPAQQAVLLRLRHALRDHMLKTRDLALLPEPMLQRLATAGTNTTPWDFGHDPQLYPLERLLELTNMQLAPVADTAAIRGALADSSALVRYWALADLLHRGAQETASLRADLIRLLGDSEPVVRIAAANALAVHGMGDAKQQAIESLLALSLAPETDFYSRLWALNALDQARPLPKPVNAKLATFAPDAPDASTPAFAKEYLPRLLEHMRSGERPSF
jgi:arylsulfatase A-like enzyme